MANSLLMRIDPKGYEERRKARAAARRLEIRHGDHGSSTLFAELPSDRAQALYAACDQDALAKKRQGDSSTMDQLRLDALVERCLGGDCGGKPKAQIFLHIDLPTLMGLRDNPAELTGCGEISPELAREIAFDANSQSEHTAAVRASRALTVATPDGRSYTEDPTGFFWWEWVAQVSSGSAKTSRA